MRKMSACSSTLNGSKTQKPSLNIHNEKAKQYIVDFRSRKFDAKMGGRVGQDLSVYLTFSVSRIDMCLTLKVQKFDLFKKIIESLSILLIIKRLFTHTKFPFKMFVSVSTYFSNRSHDKMDSHLYKP